MCVSYVYTYMFSFLFFLMFMEKIKTEKIKTEALTEVERGIAFLWCPERFGCGEGGMGREVRSQALHTPRLVVQGTQGGGHRKEGGDGCLPHHSGGGAGWSQARGRRGGARGGGRGGGGRRRHGFHRFSQDGEGDRLLFKLHVFKVLVLLRSRGGPRRGFPVRRRPGEGWGELAVPAALLGDLVEEVNGRPAALGQTDAQLAQVGAGVAGQPAPRLKVGSAHLTLQKVGDCNRAEDSNVREG